MRGQRSDIAPSILTHALPWMLIASLIRLIRRIRNLSILDGSDLIRSGKGMRFGGLACGGAGFLKTGKTLCGMRATRGKRSMARCERIAALSCLLIAFFCLGLGLLFARLCRAPLTLPSPLLGRGGAVCRHAAPCASAERGRPRSPEAGRSGCSWLGRGWSGCRCRRGFPMRSTARRRRCGKSGPRFRH